MSEKSDQISYQKVWQIQVSGLRLLEFTSDHNSFAVYDKGGELRLFNHNGQELWHRNTGYDLVSIALADTLEVLAVDVDKHSIFFGQEGMTMWRKRPFPAVLGRISANGELFSFVTPDPAIIGADRSLRVKWSYRNLMKRPADLAVSAGAECVAFACADERGEGFGAVNQAGRPLDSFMGLGNIIALSLNQNGSTALVLSARGHIFCMNLQRGSGIWKGAFGNDLIGVSYASETGESLAYSAGGQLVKLDANGLPVWEHRMPDRLLKASLSADGNLIFYASERGEIGMLAQNSGELNNHLVFKEATPRSLSPSLHSSFMKVWNVELVGSDEQQSKVYIWKGQDGVEYCLVWDGGEKLFCINDLGEEVWNNRLSATRVLDIAVSSEADMAVIVTSAGVMGFDLSGCELFKFFGQFKRVHLFADAAMVFLDSLGKCKFYLSSDHFSHQLEITERVTSFSVVGEKLLLRSEKSLYLLNSEGVIEKNLDFTNAISCCNLSSSKEFLLCGDTGGQVVIYNLELEVVFSYQLAGVITLIEYNREYETLFVAGESEEIAVLNRRSGEKFKVELTGRPALMTAHEAGAIVGTDLDQLGLISAEGQILARYTSPHKLKKMLPCHRKMRQSFLQTKLLPALRQ
jgi:WD40 repeat protein